MCPSKNDKDRSFDISQSRCVIDGQLGRYSQPYFHLVKPCRDMIHPMYSQDC